MHKYYKNLILCGTIDFFCLLCEESFEHSDEVEKHVRWEQHRKLLKGLDYLAKFKKDYIYKISDYYYCEICNFVSSSFKGIKDHVKEENHEFNKTNPKCDNKEIQVIRKADLILISNLTVSKKEWHGVVNSKCLFCNTLLIKFNEHITSPTHMINLVQAALRVEHDDWIYRKINADTYYCFNCKKTVSGQDLSDHWNSDEHSAKERNGNQVKQLFSLNREIGQATCNLCFETIDWTSTLLYSHREKHIKHKEWEINEEIEEHAISLLQFPDKGQMRSDLKKYGKDNFIELIAGGAKGYCTICYAYISAHIINFKQHVNGIRHTNFLELRSSKKAKKLDITKHKTKTTKQLFNEEQILLLSDLQVLAIHPGFGITMMKFMMMSEDNPAKKIVCFQCDQYYTCIEKHMEHKLHKEKIMNTLVVILKDEFVREIRPGFYHCGYCNIPFAGWSVMEKHLRSINHGLAKVECMQLLKKIANMCKNSHDNISSSSNSLDEDLGSCLFSMFINSYLL